MDPPSAADIIRQAKKDKNIGKKHRRLGNKSERENVSDGVSRDDGSDPVYTQNLRNQSVVIVGRQFPNLLNATARKNKYAGWASHHTHVMNLLHSGSYQRAEEIHRDKIKVHADAMIATIQAAQSEWRCLGHRDQPDQLPSFLVDDVPRYPWPPVGWEWILSQQPAQPTPLGQPVPLGQPPGLLTFGQPAPLAQPTPFGQPPRPMTFGQPASLAQPTPFGQPPRPMTFGQPASLAQPTPFGQPPRPLQFGQPALIGQIPPSGQSAQPSPFLRQPPLQFPQPPLQFPQPSPFGRPNPLSRTNPFAQPAPSVPQKRSPLPPSTPPQTKKTKVLIDITSDEARIVKEEENEDDFDLHAVRSQTISQTIVGDDVWSQRTPSAREDDDSETSAENSPNRLDDQHVDIASSDHGDDDVVDDLAAHNIEDSPPVASAADKVLPSIEYTAARFRPMPGQVGRLRLRPRRPKPLLRNFIVGSEREGTLDTIPEPDDPKDNDFEPSQQLSSLVASPVASRTRLGQVPVNHHPIQYRPIFSSPEPSPSPSPEPIIELESDDDQEIQYRSIYSPPQPSPSPSPEPVSDLESDAEEDVEPLKPPSSLRPKDHSSPCPYGDLCACDVNHMVLLAKSSILVQMFIKVMKNIGAENCATVHLLRNPLMGLMAVIQRVREQGPSRAKLILIIPKMCSDPAHHDNKRVPLSQIAIFVNLVETQGLEAAIEVYRKHYEVPGQYQWAHDCHQPQCEQPAHQFSQLAKHNAANTCKREAIEERAEHHQLLSSKCSNPICLSYQRPCRRENALLDPVSITIQNFATLNKIPRLSTLSTKYLIGNEWIDKKLLPNLLYSQCGFVAVKDKKLVECKVAGITRYFLKRPPPIPAPYDVDALFPVFAACYNPDEPFLQPSYDPIKEIELLCDLNREVFVDRDYCCKESKLSCKFCHSRWAISQGKVTKADLKRTYTAAKYVKHVMSHMDDFEGADKYFVLGSLADELDVSFSFLSGLVYHICTWDITKHGVHRQNYERDFDQLRREFETAFRAGFIPFDQKLLDK